MGLIKHNIRYYGNSMRQIQRIRYYLGVPNGGEMGS